jgi:osmotically-inducible protein OsmY
MRRAIAVALLFLSAACASQAPIEQNISDEQLVYLVQDALAREPELIQTSIAVSAMNGTVELSGAVRTQRQRQVAERVSHQIEGVRAVIDNIRVQ